MKRYIVRLNQENDKYCVWDVFIKCYEPGEEYNNEFDAEKVAHDLNNEWEKNRY